jgi:hypothetical protein
MSSTIFSFALRALCQLRHFMDLSMLIKNNLAKVFVFCYNIYTQRRKFMIKEMIVFGMSLVFVGSTQDSRYVCREFERVNATSYVNFDTCYILVEATL